MITIEVSRDAWFSTNVPRLPDKYDDSLAILIEEKKMIKFLNTYKYE